MTRAKLRSNFEKVFSFNYLSQNNVGEIPGMISTSMSGILKEKHKPAYFMLLVSYK